MFVYLRTMENNKRYSQQQQRVARYAKALGHPARVAILQFLDLQTTCFFGDIQEVLPIAKATVSQHLSELKASGLIQGEIEPPKVRYCINREEWNQARGLFGELFGKTDNNDNNGNNANNGNTGNTGNNHRSCCDE